MQSKCFRILEDNGFEIIPKNEVLEFVQQVDEELAEDFAGIDELDIKTTEKLQLCKARIGQGLFRKRLEAIESGCRVTGVTDQRVLNASHIKPWRDSNNVERLDGNNGLLLSVHVDRLFDRGLISFTDAGVLLVKDASVSKILESWYVDPNACVGRFNSSQCVYLCRHRKANGFA